MLIDLDDILEAQVATTLRGTGPRRAHVVRLSGRLPEDHGLATLAARMCADPLTPRYAVVELDCTSIQTDTVTGDSIEVALQTCTNVSQGGGKCSLYHNEGTGHTVNLDAGGPFWPEIASYLWNDLNLFALVPA